jgi:hypothetical protein
MSLYQLQKLLYAVNRGGAEQAAYREEREALLARYELADEERAALREPDIGLLYVLGVNPQILMHFAAALGIDWFDYVARMQCGLAQHGPVRAGPCAALTAPPTGGAPPARCAGTAS